MMKGFVASGRVLVRIDQICVVGTNISAYKQRVLGFSQISSIFSHCSIASI